MTSTLLLATPIKIGKLELKNRMVMAPMATHFAAEDGSATDKLKNYYVERAKGGVAMITLESCFINQNGRGGIRRLGLYKDSLVPKLKEVIGAVHEAGAKACCELHHGGPQCKTHITGEQPLCASSSYFQVGIIDPPRTVLKEEIPVLLDEYAQAARRAVECGFDSAMLHFGHGYLAHSFLSPLTNRRKDEYGGSLENRLRFPMQILSAVRAAVGPDFPIIVRMAAEDGLVGGISLAESIEMGKVFEKAGTDAINVTAGIHLSMEYMVQPMAMPRGVLTDYAKAFKAELRIPVGTVGRINNPELAEDVLQQGKADYVYLGRPLIVDPQFPKKAVENRSGDIRPCIACNQGCNGKLHLNETITCFVNPRVGREAEFPLTPVKNPKKVLVLGGGPAGMQAALFAAQRGHKVSLYEKDSFLGGDLFLAGKPPKKEEITNMVQTTARQLKELGVDVHLNTELTKEQIKALSPEAVIVAIGAGTGIPPIPGVDLPHVVTSQAALKEPEKIKGRVVVIGGGSTGCETAELLAHQGCSAVVVEMLPKVAQDLENNRRRLLMESLSDMGVRLLVNAKVKKITTDSVVLDWRDGENIFPADHVVMATGVRARKNYENLASELGVPVYYAGSCVNPGPGIDAMREGFEQGMAV